KRILGACPVIIHNATYDMAFLRAKGFKVGNLAHDTLLLSHAIHPELKHRLSYVASVYADIPYWKNTLEDKEAATLSLPDKALREYNLWDCVVLHMILPPMIADARALGVWDTYTKVSLPLVEPVMEMTRVGVGFDRDAQRKWERELTLRAKTLERDLRESFSLPSGFNLASGPHLTYFVYGDVPPGLEKALASFRARTLEIDILTKERDALRERAKAGLIVTKKEASRLVSLEGQVVRKSSSAVFGKCEDLAGVLELTPLVLPRGAPRKHTEKGGTSLDDEAIQGILTKTRARVHEIAGMRRPPSATKGELVALERTDAFLSGVLDLREVSKLLSTYGDFETWNDGRVHFPFKMAGTATGRLSSGDKRALGVGNGQNIPKEARTLFVAAPGNVIVGADYASLEPRMIAYLSGDDLAIRDFDAGIKVYDAIIRDTLGIPKDDPSYKDIRDAIKVYVLGTNYGGGLEGVFKQMGIKCKTLPFSLPELKALHARRLALHPALASWTSSTITEVQRTRVLKNAFGRRRVFLGPRSAIAREALDYGPQSSGADLVNMVMIRLHKRLHAGTKTPNTHIILQLHDALYLETPLAEAREAARALVEEMERPIDVAGYKGVVFPVELSWGPSWGDM
ncbi:MAG: DNA polymerase, partial [Spirochaetia bacterium]|nr:DNA polymerase [Spirochaetia bacterium]